MDSEKTPKVYKFGVQKIWEGKENDRPAYIVRLVVGNWVESRTIKGENDLLARFAKAKEDLATLYEIFENQFPGITPEGMVGFLGAATSVAPAQSSLLTLKSGWL